VHAQTNPTTWRAELSLTYERRGARTVLAARRHEGPLVVQKPLYPEGDDICHTIIVHPPAGIVGGDELAIGSRLDAGAHALLTTPGAGKWYRSAGSWAKQNTSFEVASGASLEWLPQESIVFDGAKADLRTTVHLNGDAVFLGWEILCLGRTGSGEHFSHGECRVRTLITRDGRPLWLERGAIDGGGDVLSAGAVLADQPVVGTFVATAADIPDETLPACRAIRVENGDGAVTRLPGVVVARYLGASSEAAKKYFLECWRVLRPGLLKRDAVEPRIWRT
jgi:urease accessory protein